MMIKLTSSWTIIFMDGVIYIKQKHIYDDNKIEVFMDHYQF
jgi:hypothetical protein